MPPFRGERAMSGEIILYDELARQDAMNAIEKLGQKFAASGMFGITKPAQGEVMAMTCLTERMSPLRFSQIFHIVEGRVSMRADAMLAKYQEIGGKVIWLESTDKIARARWLYAGNDIEIKFTIEDAHRAELCGPNGVKKHGQTKNGNWQKTPDAMLRARCVSKAIRMLAPQVNSGIYTPEEVADFDDAPQSSAPAAAGRKPFPKKEAELKDADARVVDDAPPAEVPPAKPQAANPSADAALAKPPDEQVAEAAVAELSLHEDVVNAYLVHLKYITPGQTFRDLKDLMRVRAFSAPAKLIAQAKLHAAAAEDGKESA